MGIGVNEIMRKPFVTLGKKTSHLFLANALQGKRILDNNNTGHTGRKYKSLLLQQSA